MRARAHHWPHIPEEKEAFQPALKADKTLAKQGMTEFGHGGALSKKACRIWTCVFKGLLTSRLRLGFPKKALLPHKQPEQVARKSKGYEVLSKKKLTPKCQRGVRPTVGHT